jgi:hypothetical protein
MGKSSVLREIFKMRNLVVPSLLVTSVLIARNSNAQLAWTELQTTQRGCAKSIGVGANDIPWVVGCGSAADQIVFYLNSYTCSGCLAATLSWQNVPGAAGVNLAVNRDGYPFVANSSGQIASPVWNGQTNVGDYSAIAAWQNLTASPSTCVSSVAPAEFSSFDIFEPNAFFGTGGVQNTIYGLGCTTTDSYGDRPILSWNFNLQNIFSIYWQASPGWERMGASANNGLVQIALFNGSGANNPQALAGRDAFGSLWQYSASQGVFVQPPGFNALSQAGWTVFALTDHYAEAYYGGNAATATVFQWNDSSSTWAGFATAVTGENTVIVQIASSQSMQTSSGTFGPSQIYGIDSSGHIFVLGAESGLK